MGYNRRIMKIHDNTISHDEVIDLLYTSLPYEQNLVYVIDDEGRDHLISSVSEINAFDSKTIKIEGMERYNNRVWDLVNSIKSDYGHTGPVTCHVFLAESGSPSFSEHTDPDDVVILCCEGTKTLKINNKTITLEQGDTVLIPRDTPHQALNTESSLIMSIGLERFFVDKIREDY